MYAKLTNLDMDDADGNGESFHCVMKDRTGSRLFDFTLSLKGQQLVYTAGVFEENAQVPEFLQGSIAFKEGASMVFFREVLKVATSARE